MSDKSNDNSFIQLKLGDIIQLYSSSNADINNGAFIISYIDSEKLILSQPERAQPVVLTLNEDGTFAGVSIEQIDLLNRSEKDGYLAQNNLNIGDLLELPFVEQNGAITKIYGQLKNIEEDMMTLVVYPSNQEIYIDFAYRGIPLELNLRSINVIDAFPQEVEVLASVETGVAVEADVDVTPISAVDQPMAEDKGETPAADADADELSVVDADIQDKTRQLFIDADQLFLGAELGEVRQEVQLGDKERRYGLETQLNDLLEEMLSVIPNEERNTRVLGNINNMIQKFKQLRDEHSEFDDYDNASKKPKDVMLNTPLVKSILKINQNLKWLVPVVKAKKHLNNLGLEDELLQNVETNDDYTLLSSLDDFMNNYYKADTGNSQNRYDQYLRFMHDYFKSHSQVSAKEENRVIGTQTLEVVNGNINVLIDNLGDLYSEIARGLTKGQVEMDRSRFKTLTLNGDTMRRQLVKSKMGEINIQTIPISTGDNIQLSSLLLMPEKITASNTSHINTRIIDKTQTSTNTDYYAFFRKATSVVNKYVSVKRGGEDDANKNLKTDIAKHIVGRIADRNNLWQVQPSQEFIDALYDLPADERSSLYIDFLSQFLPSNSEILGELSKKGTTQYKDITSIHELVKQLSSFMVSKTNFTSDDAEVAQQLINKNILRIKQRLVKRGDELNTIVQQETAKKGGVEKEAVKNSIELLLSNVPLVDDYGDGGDTTKSLVIINIIKGSLENYYAISKDHTSAEAIHAIYSYDGGRFLNLCLSYLSLGLHSTLDLNSELNAVDQLIQSQIEEASETNECQEVTLSNKYTSLATLNTDNKEFIYFDADYDETRYDILDIYREQQASMPSPQFKEFLKNKLIENVGMSEDRARREADAMISGKRLVEEGNVAILEIPSDAPRYYSRENNEWKRNVNIRFDVQTGSLLCETKKDCYKIKNTCANEDLANQLINASNIQSMVNIFDVKQEKTRKQLQSSLGRAIQMLYSNKENLEAHKNSTRKALGVERKQIANEMTVANSGDEGTQIKSPYSKLFQAIMGQEDFVQQQNNIVKFVNQFTYDIDNEHWFLCIKTSQKLIPKFLYTLAKAFISGDDYFLVREQICSIQGVLSDDGDKWVDKHSGYMIKNVDASGEEGYDGQGYKLQVREGLEDAMDKIIRERQEDINTAVSGKDGDNVIKFKDSDFTAPHSDSVLKIVNAMGRSIGLDLHQHKPFIVNNVLRLNTANFTTKENYDKKATLAKKQKNITLPSFEMALNLNILLLTLCFIILAIQLAKPSLKTKKSVPGCFKYFKGFPYDANGDNGAVVYIACIVDKMKNAKSMPWKSLGKTKTSGLVKKLMAKFDKQILKDKQVLDDIDDKKQWELNHPEEEALEKDDGIPKGAALDKWNTFRPGLDVDYQVSAVSPLSDEFKREMLDDIKKGSRKQQNKVDTVIGKIVEQSTYYKNLINTIVAESDMILKNVYQEPYMQNCFANTPITEADVTAYFNSKNGLLSNLADGIRRNEKIISDLRNIIKSPLMNPHFDTKKQISTAFGDFTEETIYKYFIHQCHFGDEAVIDAGLTRLCGAKPFGFDPSLSVREQVAFLKSNGHQYSSDSLTELLKLVGKRTSIDRELFINLYDETHFVFKHFVDKFSAVNKQSHLHQYLFDADLNKIFERVFSLNIDTNGYIDSSLYTKLNAGNGTMRELKNTLTYSTESSKQEVIDFFKAQTNTTRKQTKQLEDFVAMFNTVDEFNTGQYESIQQIMYLTCIVFPNMVINSASFSDIVLPKHWGLSELHKKDVLTLLTNFYKRFRQFYSDTTERGEEGMDSIDESHNATHMFKRAMMLCKPHLKSMYEFLCELPFTSQPVRGNKYYLFDTRFQTLFIKYAFIKSIHLHVKCTTLVNDRGVVLRNYERSRLGVNDSGAIENARKNEAITETEIYEFMNQQMSDEDVAYNDDVSLLELMNEYLVEIAPVITKFYATSSTSFNDIYKKVLASRENEKNTITRTLKDMSDEEREVQNLFKGHKLESWGKGLTKGLTRYVKENYDEERAAIEKRLDYERQMKTIDVATKMNMEIFMEEADYQRIVEEEVEGEEYSMEHLGEDDDYGNDMDGDEFY